MKRSYLYPLPLRIWHWVNALIVIMLILTGMQLRIPDIKFFAGYPFAVSIHKYLGFALVGSFFFWLVFYLFVGELTRHYLLTRSDIRGISKQAFFYIYGLFRGKENPFRPSATSKFNPLQKIAYFFIMFICMPVIMVSGILFSNIFYFLSFINIIGGIRVLDAIHVAFGYFFAIYLMVHVYMATSGRGVFSHIKTMITGYEEE